MELHLPLNILEAAKTKKPDSHVEAELKRNVFKRKIVLDGLKLQPETIRALNDQITKDNKETPWGRIVTFLFTSLSDGKGATFTDVISMGAALKSLMNSKRIKGWVFARGSNSSLLPYLVTDVEADQKRNSSYSDKTVAQFKFTMRYGVGDVNEANSMTVSVEPERLASFFAKHNVAFERQILTSGRGREKHDYTANVTTDTPVSIEVWLNYIGYFVETKGLHEKYEKQLDRYMAVLPKYGQQILLRGTDQDGQVLTLEGKPARAILTTIPTIVAQENNYEDEDERPRGARVLRASSMRRNSANTSDDSRYSPEAVAQLATVQLEDLQASWVDEKDEVRHVLPLHPLFTVFHLEHHDFFRVHINNAKMYEYNVNLAENLILPKQVKQLTQMLVATTQAEAKKDVIEDKSQAQIIACVGDPGLGKTLLAEVMAESCQKPLYKIQAAQLGLDAEELEGNLRLLLRRAERWGAVVMIDEANAYIHSRGHDIRQNAIVGVFLRLLEYFRGTMIVTTNLTSDGEAAGFDIDDAILSRCTAVFQFKIPSVKQRAQIWKLQARIMEIEIPKDVIAAAAEQFKISGRTIRHLLRLSSNWAKMNKEELSLDHLTTCFQFTPRTTSESAPEQTDDKE